VEVDDTDFATDFQLYYTLADSDFGLNALTHREPGEPGYFMLLLSPKQDWGEREIEGKNLVLALDTSGSMVGQKIEQAKAALKQVLQGLRPGDRFGLLTFATETRRFADGLLPVNQANVGKAMSFVAGLEARGSTALNDAMTEAVGLTSTAEERPSMVMLLTDGLPTQGERNPEQIVKNVAAANGTESDDEPDDRRSRVFIFGVGDDVNTHLLDRVAEGNGGATTYVRPAEDIEAAVSGLYAKLSHPVLTDVKLDIGGINPHEIYPARLPDLFVGSQVIVTGRYDGDGAATVELTGQAAGERRADEYKVDFPREAEADAFVARVWAVRRIGYLLDEVRLHGEDKELKDEIVRLAVQFGIVTPYTSYLVQEDEDLRRREGGSVAQNNTFQRSGDALGTGPGMPGMAGMPGMSGAAGAPADGAREAMKAQVGGGAVHAAQNLQYLRNASQTGAGDQTTYRNVARRTFYNYGVWWLDSAWEKDLQIVQVKAFSAAYFELLQLRPDLAQYLSLGSQVKLRLGQVGLVVAPEGDEALNDTQRTQLRH